MDYYIELNFNSEVTPFVETVFVGPGTFEQLNEVLARAKTADDYMSHQRFSGLPFHRTAISVETFFELKYGAPED